MVNTYYNHKYAVWHSPFTESKFLQELEDAFDSTKIFDAKEKKGNAKSLQFSVLQTFQSYQQIYNFVVDQISLHFDDLQIPKYYQKQKLNLLRCWANRMYKGSSGTIHYHRKTTVFLYYINVPPNSGNLVFINPKYENMMLHDETEVPDQDKQIISVSTGTCILHNGRLLHAVSEHNSDVPRDVVVFEFDSIFR